MSWYELLKNVELIRSKLQDEESRVIFDARLGYMCNGDRYRYEYFNQIDQFPKKWSSLEMDSLLSGDDRDIIIYGYNQLGIEQKRAIELSGYMVTCWCDNNESIVGEVYEGIPVISIRDLIANYNKPIVIISSKFEDERMRNNLIEAGFPEENIYSPKYGVIVSNTGEPYFDIFKPCEGEIFVDAGAYDGQTILDFLKWTGGNFEKIYSLEPLPDMYKKIKDKSVKEGWKNVQLENCAAWDKEDSLEFVMADAGSRVNFVNKTEDVIKVKAKDIDTIVGEDKVTYLKMDIEGSELKALMGARRCIKNHKPKLAICIYHKPGDVVELASYILMLNSDYKFYIRHYASNMWETVLYAE